MIAEAEGLTVYPGATVDRAKAAVRVRGNRRQFALSGDLDVGPPTSTRTR